MVSSRFVWFTGVILLSFVLVTPGLSGSDNTASGYIVVGQAPVAGFGGYYSYPSVPLQVSFRDFSTGSSPMTYQWDFGDGSMSTEQNPTHSYTRKGRYTVILSVTNAYGSDREVKQDYIAVGIGPEADFTADPTSGNIPMTVRFTDLSRGQATGWQWDFGDGISSSLQNPVHTYYSAGTYNVILTVSNAFGSSYTTKNRYITAGDQMAARFLANPSSGPVPLSVFFTDQSTGDPDTWSWDFGDGTTSTAENPLHTFNTSGAYPVKLTVTKGTLSDTSEQIVDAGGVPVANFTAASTHVNVKEAVRFSDVSTGTPSAWAWNFGDTVTSSEQNPTHAYQAKGIYTVSLTAINANGRNTVTKTGYINVGLAPIADFRPVINPRQASQVPLYVRFVDQSENLPSSWLWDFGDGTTSADQNPSHLYETAGTYTVSLTASNPFGSDTEIRPDLIVAGKEVAIDFMADRTRVGVGRYVTFTDLSTNAPASWVWDFGDGSIGTSSRADHIYQKAGVYTVTLTTSNLSVQNTLTKKQYVTVLNLPNADFSASPARGSAPLTVNFTDTSTGMPSSWTWSFGDGETSGEQNPVHTYTQIGTYTVTLTVANENGADTITKGSCIAATQAPVADFTVSERIGSTPFVVQFTDLSTNNPTSWFWQFGDGTTSSEQNPRHQYRITGSYNVSLTVANEYGSDTTYKAGGPPGVTPTPYQTMSLSETQVPPGTPTGVPGAGKPATVPAGTTRASPTTIVPGSAAVFSVLFLAGAFRRK